MYCRRDRSRLCSNNIIAMPEWLVSALLVVLDSQCELASARVNYDLPLVLDSTRHHVTTACVFFNSEFVLCLITALI